MSLNKVLLNYVRPKELSSGLERRTFLFLFILSFVQIIAFQAWQTLYTNYIVEAVGLNGAQNGIVQSVRELPGLLAISVLFFVALTSETKMALISVFMLSVGVGLTGFFSTYQGMLITTLIMSIGYHYYESLNQSLTLQSFSTRVAPIVISRVRSISALGTILVTLFLFFSTKYFSYKINYLLPAIICIIGVFFAYTKMPNLESLTQQKKGIVLKKKYWLFYILTFLSGGRRQIFTIFSLFLLVEKFSYSASMVAGLFLINNFVNWLLNPLIGRLINILGEKKLLSIQFSAAIFIFLGYCYSNIGFVVAFLYILDQFTYSFNIAEKTFFQKLADKEDIAPSMAMSFTINHISAVTIPVIGGALWLIDYKYPFFIGIVIAVSSLCLVQLIDRQLSKKAMSN